MAQFGIWDYVKAAFKEPYNVILLSGGFLGGIVSLTPLVVWPILSALEILYLLGAANSRRFQAVVKARAQRGAKVESDDLAARLINSLDSRRKLRFQQVRTRCLGLHQTIKGAIAGSDNLGGLLESQQLESVNQLLWVFLRTLAYEQVLESFCATMPKADIQRTLNDATQALKAEDLTDQMRAAYQENIEVLNKRLENLHRAERNLKTIQTRLVRVENSIMLIQEQAVTRQDPAFIESEVNSATAGLSSVEQMLRSMNLPAIDTAATGPTPELLSAEAQEVKQQ
jgi:hypothetical protein